MTDRDPHRPVRLVIAENLRRAQHTCEYEWGWPRSPRQGPTRPCDAWIDQHGCEVRYVFHPEQLHGHARGTVIYLAGGYWMSEAIRGYDVNYLTHRDFAIARAPAEAPPPR